MSYELTPTSNDLCCKIHPDIKCRFCKHVMCSTCAEKWSRRKHFILDLCRKRFTESQLTKAADCYKKRMKTKKPRALGNCYVCNYRREAFLDGRGSQYDRRVNTPPKPI